MNTTDNPRGWDDRPAHPEGASAVQERLGPAPLLDERLAEIRDRLD